MTALSHSMMHTDMLSMNDPFGPNIGQTSIGQSLGQSGINNNWHLDYGCDLTLNSPGPRSRTPGSPESPTLSPMGKSCRSPTASRSSSSAACSVVMATSSTPESEGSICALVDEEFLNHYRVREIMDNLQYANNYSTPQTAMFAASAYYEYYDTYPGGGHMSDLGYSTPDIKIGIEELCPVCGDKVSGYHYGLQTCESCKGFFKRTVQNKKVYSCVDNRNCMIDKTQRKRCPYCRFQKCISVGMKLEAVRADRMRGGRNKFGPMYKRDRALKQQAVRQRQQMFAQMQYSMQFNGLNGPGMPPAMMDSFGGMGSDIKPNISMLGLPPTHPGQDGSPPGHMGPHGSMMPHPYHPRQMLPMNSHHGDGGGGMSPGPHHTPTSLHSSHGGYLPHGPPPPHPHSQAHYPPPVPPSHMMSGMNSQHGMPPGHVPHGGAPAHGMNMSGGSGMGGLHNLHPSGIGELSPPGISPHDNNNRGTLNGGVLPPSAHAHNSHHNTSGGPGSLHHQLGNGGPSQHHSGDIVSMATGLPSVPSPMSNSGVPQLIRDLQKNEPDPQEVHQKLASIAEMMLQQQSMMSPEQGIMGGSGDLSTCGEVSKPILQLVCRVCDQALFLLVEWARSAYFFRDLRVEDQMKLLQTCWSELLILDFVFKQMTHNKPRHLVLGTGHMVSIDALDQVGLSDVKERLVDLASKFRDLKLDPNEFTCLKFLILLNPDVIGLVNRSQVEDYQKKVNVVLMDYCNNFYPAIQDKFGQLLVRLPEIRLFSLRAEDYLYFQHISGNIPENTLLMEMLHSKRK